MVTHSERLAARLDRRLHLRHGRLDVIGGGACARSCRTGGATRSSLLTLVLGLALATALWSGVQAINAEARASYDARGDRPRRRRALRAGRRGRRRASRSTTYVALRRAGWLVSPGDRGLDRGRTAAASGFWGSTR